MTSFANVFSHEDIEFLTQHPAVINAKATPSVFTIPITETIRNSLLDIGLDTNATEIPMRWVVGDVPLHEDVCESQFEKTFLVYINDNPGEFVLDNIVYSITENTAFVFNEGVSHMTRNTGTLPRLLLGPMNEFAKPVGAAAINYFPSETDALNGTNYLGFSGFTVDGGSFGYKNWRIASNSTGSSQSVVYANGDLLDSSGFYNMYPAITCFLEGTRILSFINGEETYVRIEDLRKGDLVKTIRDGYKKIELIAKGIVMNPGNDERIENRLYKCSPANYSELKNDLYITGCHSILVNTLTEVQRAKINKLLGKLFITDRKYRLMAFLDERAEPWKSEGHYTIWHLALENTNERTNYGIYAEGLLVETCFTQYLRKSNMTIV